MLLIELYIPFIQTRQKVVRGTEYLQVHWLELTLQSVSQVPIATCSSCISFPTQPKSTLLYCGACKTHFHASSLQPNPNHNYWEVKWQPKAHTLEVSPSVHSRPYFWVSFHSITQANLLISVAFISKELCLRLQVWINQLLNLPLCHSFHQVQQMPPSPTGFGLVPLPLLCMRCSSSLF